MSTGAHFKGRFVTLGRSKDHDGTDSLHELARLSAAVQACYRTYFSWHEIES